MLDDLTHVARCLYTSIGTTVAKSCIHMLDRGDWKGLASLKVDPRSYDSAITYLLDATAASFLKKCAALPTGIDKAAVAKETWLACELKNYRTNQRLWPYAVTFGDTLDQRIVDFFDAVRKKVASWIGWFPPSLRDGRFGPGSSFSRGARESTTLEKIAGVPSVTTRAWVSVYPVWVDTLWGRSVGQHENAVEFVEGNRFSTAPKDATTDRSIGVEPDICIYYQLGIDNVLRGRLRSSTGWDLSRAQDIHRRLAYEASVTRQRATLDLRNASNTITDMFVKCSVPPAWYDRLSSLRSPKTLVDGKWRKLEMFSSMGNGYTFTLETILFAAISSVVANLAGKPGVLGEDIFVYGDDIIVDNDLVRPLKAALEFCGLELNLDKSFWGESKFRESCGADFFEGRPVRPYFQKKEPREPHEWIACANGLRRVALPFGLFMLKPWLRVLSNLPSEIRACRGPESLGDIVIHDSAEHWSFHPYGNSVDGIRRVKTWSPALRAIVPSYIFPDSVQLACAVGGFLDQTRVFRYETDELGNVVGFETMHREGAIPRDAVLGYRTKWVTIP